MSAWLYSFFGWSYKWAWMLIFMVVIALIGIALAFTLNGMIKSSLVGILAAIFFSYLGIIKVWKDNRQSLKKV